MQEGEGDGGVSPTARTLKALRDGGAVCEVVERWNSFAKVRQDTFGILDILVLRYDGFSQGAIEGVQATSDDNHSKRRDKILASDKAVLWLRCGGRLTLWSWGLKGPAGKRKRWTARVEEFVLIGGKIEALG